MAHGWNVEYWGMRGWNECKWVAVDERHTRVEEVFGNTEYATGVGVETLDAVARHANLVGEIASSIFATVFYA
jgi:uncharacterized protein YraI